MRFVKDDRRNRTIVQMDNARIVWPNFEGRADTYNRPGDRNFAVVIPDLEMAGALNDMGYNVKIRPPREEGEEPFITLAVKVRFNDYGPKIYLQTGDKRIILTEETVGCIDKIDISSCDLDIRPYEWSRPDGSSGTSAYLQGALIVQELDRFASYNTEDRTDENDIPFADE